jgi:hypothetical protein
MLAYTDASERKKEEIEEERKTDTKKVKERIKKLKGENNE